MKKTKCIKSKRCIAVMVLAMAMAVHAVEKSERETSGTVNRSIMVFAAVSLTDVLAELSDSFEVTHAMTIKTNMASSGTLARQIEQGNVADVFISASSRWMRYVDSLGYMQHESVREIVRNELVAIVPEDSRQKEITIDSTLDFAGLLQSGRLSMGDPAHVPAGKYAREALEYFGWYTALTSRLLPAKDVRSALMVVELGEAPLGIVYMTDMLKSTKVRKIAVFPESSHTPIVYMAGACDRSASGKTFVTYLASEETWPVWKKYGFKTGRKN